MHPQSRLQVTPEEARAIAKEAYVYGFPLVDSYRILYSYFVDRNDPEFKAAWNEKVFNNSRVFTPEDTAMQTPNSDTPYSQLGLDLRAEPMVLTMPAVEKSRYYTVQVNDLYTFISGYIGSRTTGNDAGDFLIAGPDWNGETPAGIKAVVRSETQLSFVFYRTQLFGSGDIENVKQVQAGYKVQPLSAFLNKPAPVPAPKIDFMKPISAEAERTSLEFFKILNFVLQFCPTHPSEKDLMARFAKLGIGGDQEFDVDSPSGEMRKAIEDGRADAWHELDELAKRGAKGEITSADLVGTRNYLKNNYLYRARATISGIWGNAKEEALYPIYIGPQFDGRNRYILRFAPNRLPPVNAFWSLTMYNLPARLLVANPLNRYLINSPMLPALKKDADGGVTLHVQHESPGKDGEPNWLPAPEGPFLMVMRLYWPKKEVLDGTWKQPPLERQN